MTLGFGAMLHMLGGGSEHSSEEYVSMEVTDAFIRDEKLHIHFLDGPKIIIYDDGQSCCESRYMTCDDSPADLIGGKWVSAQIQSGPKEEGEYGDTLEQQFLIVKTSKGTITIANYNSHNGYYGGFGMTIEEYHD